MIDEGRAGRYGRNRPTRDAKVPDEAGILAVAGLQRGGGAEMAVPFVAAPRVGGVAPRVGGVAPWVGVVAPWVGGVAPWVGGVAPRVGGVAPWVGGVAPWSGGVAPWSGGVVPWVGWVYHEWDSAIRELQARRGAIASEMARRMGR